jgi:hypothetical protein
MIEEYLSRLQAELSGADPAIVQDALYDADEYLRAELAGTPADEQDAALTRIYESYGTPAEVAAAYLDAERVITPRPPSQPKAASAAKRNPIAAFFGIVVDPRAWGALIYMLLAMLTGTIYFTIVVTGISLSVGLAILIIGVPIMLLFLAIVRAVSLAEGRLVEALLGERMPRRPALSPAEGGIIKRIAWWLKDYRTWTTMLYMLLMLPLGVVYFTVLTTAISFGASMFAGPVVQFVTGSPMVVTGDYGYFIEWWAVPFVWALGLLVFILTLHGAKLVGRIHAAYAKVMLVGRFSEAEQAAA